MPYRGALETVVARCEELRRKLQARLRRRIDPPPCRTLAEALAWEAELQSRLAALEPETNADATDELEGVAHAVGVERPIDDHPLARNSLAVFAIAGALVAVVVVGVLAAFQAPTDTVAAGGGTASYRLTGSIVSSRPAAHTGDRCAITLDVDRNACDLDVACPTLDQRLHADRCVDDRGAIYAQIPMLLDLDVNRHRLAFTSASEPDSLIEIRLDGPR